MNNNYLQNLKKEIEDGKVKQVSARKALLKHYILWAFVVLAVLSSSVALGQIFFIIDTSDLPVWHHLYPSLGAFLVATFPYIWVTLALVFMALAIDRFRKTEFGYRYTWRYVATLSILASLVGGFILYALGMGKLAEALELSQPHSMMWQSPTDGRVVGNIESMSTSTFVIVDKNGTSWIVINGSLTKGMSNLKENKDVRVVGFEYSTSTIPKQFVACVILPADGRPLSRELKERFFSQGQDSDLMQSQSVLEDKDKQYIFDRCVEVLQKGRANVPPPCCRPNEQIRNLKQN